MEASERDLVLRARAGDRDAFKVLCQRLYPRVFRMAMYYLRDKDSAMDATQETFLKVLKGLGSFRVTEAFLPWVLKIARNTFMDALRRKRLDPDPYPEGPDGNIVEFASDCRGPPDESQVEERAALVRNALGRLSPAHQEILRLREFEGLSYEEIAEVLDIRLGTVMSRLFLARKRLLRVLREEFGLAIEELV